MLVLTMFKCTLRVCLCNLLCPLLSHSSHLYLVLEVCLLLIWCLRYLLDFVSKSHIAHLIFAVECIVDTCSRRLLLLLLLKGQCWHFISLTIALSDLASTVLNSRSTLNLCLLLWCRFNEYGDDNCIPHTSHVWSLLFSWTSFVCRHKWELHVAPNSTPQTSQI